MKRFLKLSFRYCCCSDRIAIGLKLSYLSTHIRLYKSIFLYFIYTWLKSSSSCVYREKRIDTFAGHFVTASRGSVWIWIEFVPERLKWTSLLTPHINQPLAPPFPSASLLLLSGPSFNRILSVCLPSLIFWLQFRTKLVIVIEITKCVPPIEFTWRHGTDNEQTAGAFWVIFLCAFLGFCETRRKRRRSKKE